MDFESRKSSANVRERLDSLIREVNQHTGEFNEEICRIDGSDNRVKVYYVYSDQDQLSRPSYCEFLKQIENCRNLCDLRATYKQRNKELKFENETTIVTPSDDMLSEVPQ